MDRLRDEDVSTTACTLLAPRPHDLLWTADTSGLSAPSALPAWATPEWLAFAPVVVRREQVADPDLIPVGLRGTTRSERFPAYLSRNAVAETTPPELLADRAVWRAHARFIEFPAFKALEASASPLDGTSLIWGPTGSVGFALASGLPVLRVESDLDLVVRSFEPLTADQTELLLALRSCAICRIDIQIETGHGAFSLSEWAHGRRRVLLKTERGPFLTDDPWRQPGPA